MAGKRTRANRTTDKAHRLIRSRGLRTTVVAVAAGTLVAGMSAGGAQSALADDNSLSGLMPSSSGPSVDKSSLPQMINQDPASTDKNGLNVTVGKAVLVATDPSGTPGTTVLLANTQVSGKGTATVKVPMGTVNAKNGGGFQAPKMDGEDIVYDVNNAGGNTQQTLAASNGSYKGDLPIGVEVTTTVDGKPVEPAKMVGVSGHVVLTYKFTNKTAVPTRISYRDPDKNLVTETRDVPVPFGGAFSITLPQGFSDVSAPWAQGGMQPAGTTLAGTIMLFPPLSNTSTLTIEARADNADLPNSSMQALPLTLSDNSIGRLAFQYAPLANRATEMVYQGGLMGQSMLTKYQLMLMKYSALAAGLEKEYVVPTVEKFQDGTYQAELNQATAGVQQLADGTKQLNELLPQAQKVIGLLSQYSTLGVKELEKNRNKLNQGLDAFVTGANLLQSKLPQIKNVDALLNQYGPEGVDKALTVAESAKQVCPKVQSVDNKWDAFYTYLTTHYVPLTSYTYWDVLQAVPLLGSFMNDLKYLFENYSGYIDDCVTYAPTAVELLTSLKAALPGILTKLGSAVVALEKVSALGQKGIGYVKQFQAYEPTLFRLLDNNKCKKNPSGISKCGIIQQLKFLNAMMILAKTEVNNKMVPGTSKMASYIPTIDKLFAQASRYVDQYGPAAEQVPALMQEYADKLGVYGGYAGQVVKYGAKAEIEVARSTAELEIMNARAEAGQGLPAGPAQGANTNLGVYQYQVAGASDASRQNALLFGLAALLIVPTATFGTVLYRKHG